MKQKSDPPFMFPSLILFLVVPLIFERWSSDKNIEGNVQGGSVFTAQL